MAVGRVANLRFATLLLTICLLKCVVADILVYQQDQLLEEFRDFPATFGSEIPESGLKVRAVRANPTDGCTDLDPPPENVTLSRFAVIIARYNCSFEDKIRNAQKAGYAAVIVHNVGSNDLERMSANHAEDILIPSVFIGESNGIYIIESFLYPLPYALIITDDIPFNINNNLIIPFAIVVGLCFIIMICFMIIRCIRERRRMLRHRLPNSVLRKIPIVKFAKGMQYDTCAICLDDYVDNERLRVLPCHHAYHVKCIDPWLTKNRRVCPICKRKVFARGERRPPRRRSSTDSMSSSDADEHTPLLNNGANGSNPASAAPPATAAVGAGGENAAASSPNRAANAHVVSMTSDDDELLDDSSTGQEAVSSTSRSEGGGGRQWSFNPFDRLIQSSQQAGQQRRDVEEGGNADSPYSPIGEEHGGASGSTWNRFLRKMRFFRTAYEDQELPSDDDVEPAIGESATATARDPVSGRIAINSGTASNNILNSQLAGSFHGDDTTDDEMVGASIRDAAKRRQIRSAPNLPSTSGQASGSGGSSRVGVAALPNVNFNPLQAPSPGGSGRRSNRSGGGNYPV